MPDADPEPPPVAAERSETYPIGTPPATPSLRDIIARGIADRGPLPFPGFMETALYHPDLGYYARGAGNIGREGDFFTSVSVGPLFGELLARRFLRHFNESGRPARWRIVECGAHCGDLATDVLTAIGRLDPGAFAGLEYAIPEPLPVLRAVQRETLAEFPETVRLTSSATEFAGQPLPGIAFGNEVLDALPFHVVRREGGSWRECHVGPGTDSEFAWFLTDSGDPALKAALAGLGEGFPDGYRTEVRTCFRDFLAPLAAALIEPLMIWPDYGFPRADFYRPGRTSGTLRTFRRHQAADDPLCDPGELDITAHVDFTAVAAAAEELGGHVAGFLSQGTWLTEVAREWLLAQEGNPDTSLIRQFQTLTHPGHLGASFHILELSWSPGGRTGQGPRSRLFSDGAHG